jgi:hypothetical protein
MMGSLIVVVKHIKSRGLVRKASKMASVAAAETSLVAASSSVSTPSQDPYLRNVSIVKAMQSSLALQTYLLDAYGVAVMKAHFVDEIVSSSHPNEDQLTDSELILLALHLPHKVAPANKDARSSYLVKQEFDLIINIIIDVAQLESNLANICSTASGTDTYWSSQSGLHATTARFIIALYRGK